jgi:hypothetical protein
MWDASGGLIRDLKPRLTGGAVPDFYRAEISLDGKFVAAISGPQRLKRLFRRSGGGLNRRELFVRAGGLEPPRG